MDKAEYNSRRHQFRFHRFHSLEMGMPSRSGRSMDRHSTTLVGTEGLTELRDIVAVVGKGSGLPQMPSLAMRHLKTKIARNKVLKAALAKASDYRVSVGESA